jgi:hypothetical protein
MRFEFHPEARAEWVDGSRLAHKMLQPAVILAQAVGG